MLLIHLYGYIGTHRRADRAAAAFVRFLEYRRMMSLAVKIFRQSDLLPRAEMHAERAAFASFGPNDYLSQLYLSPSLQSILRRTGWLSINREIEYFSE